MDVVTLGAALSIMKKMPDTAASSAAAAEDAADRAEEAARTLTIDNTLSVEGRAADAKKTGDKITGLKEDLNANFSGMLFDYQVDHVVLDAEGYPASGYSGVQSYSGKTASKVEMPFYKVRPIYNEWHPASNLSNVYRNLVMTPPQSVSGKLFQIGFWVYNDLTATKSFKFGILPERNSFDAIFSTTAHVGYTQTVGTATLVIDAEYNNWLHFLITVDDSSGTNNTEIILLGSNYCQTSETVKFCPPIITLGNNQQWFINYENISREPIKNEISEIRNYNPLYEKKIAWRGDSIMAGLADATNKQGWYGRIVNNNQMVGENKAVSGAVMCHSPSSGYHSISDNCIDFTMTNPDYIIVDGGTNDMFNQSTFPLGTFNATSYAEPSDATTYIDALEMCFYKLITAYPMAKIGFIIPYRMTVYNPNAGGYVSYNTYPDAAVQVCKKWGVPCLDLREKTTLNYIIPSQQSLMQDFVHANADGYEKTWRTVETWLKTL